MSHWSLLWLYRLWAMVQRSLLALQTLLQQQNHLYPPVSWTQIWKEIWCPKHQLTLMQQRLVVHTFYPWVVCSLFIHKRQTFSHVEPNFLEALDELLLAHSVLLKFWYQLLLSSVLNVGLEYLYGMNFIYITNRYDKRLFFTIAKSGSLVCVMLWQESWLKSVVHSFSA